MDKELGMTESVERSRYFDPIEDSIKAMREGRMCIICDDEDRENEGDLVCSADACTPEIINFMATHGRGLICTALTGEDASRLGLAMMTRHNRAPLGTAFTVSVEAREGTTTGISAGDRARTVQVLCDPTTGPDDLVTPGHMFPLVARDGGVLVRTGQTEASVDLSRLAGRHPSGVICEIMADDGTMMRVPELRKFADKWNMPLGSVAELVEYRRRNELLVEKASERTVQWNGQTFQVSFWTETLRGIQHVAISRGELDGSVLARVQPEAPLLGRTLPDVSREILSMHGAFDRISQEGGVFLFLRQDTKETAPAQAMDAQTVGIGAQILQQLGVSRLRLLTNHPRRFHSLAGYGLQLDGQESYVSSLDNRSIDLLEFFSSLAD
jgi:3,4-dihydroxy 2-butanone 4-phosphate synthase / GTP cyclohydrolase II